MAEYIYLLENRLSPVQKHALAQVRDAAREAGMTVFLVGGAVRDLTTGSSVRNFDFAVQGNALELEKALVEGGGALWGVDKTTRSLQLFYPGSVLVSVSSTRSEEYPKPGKPVYTWSSIVDDLRRRDFTANAMGLSLNEGSYGLLLDPLNGIADIEARVLRLGSNYGFIEDPSRLVRASRLSRRLGWELEEKTAQRYANAKEEEVVQYLSPALAGVELQKIASEEDAIGTLKALEAEGWMTHLYPAWTSAKADTAGLEALRKVWIQLMVGGVSPDLAAAHLVLLTAKMSAAEVAGLKKMFAWPGMVKAWESLDEDSKEFAKLLTGKGAATPSATWKLLTSHAAEPILWLAYTRKAGTAADQKFKNFFNVWPEARKKVPSALMLEMRITPELPGYAELLEQMFFKMLDGELETEEQLKAFLEPFSPPAPPPPPTLKRTRGKKSEGKGRKKAVLEDDEDEDSRGEDDDEDDDDEDEEEQEVDGLDSVFARLQGGRGRRDGFDLDAAPDGDADADAEADAESDSDSDSDDTVDLQAGSGSDADDPDDDDGEPVVKVAARGAAAKKPAAAKAAPEKKPAAEAAKPVAAKKAEVPVKVVAPAAAKAVAAKAPAAAKKGAVVVAAPPAKKAAVVAVPAKAVPAKAVAAKAPVKAAPAKAVAKPVAAKADAKAAPVKGKPVAKKH